MSRKRFDPETIRTAEQVWRNGAATAADIALLVRAFLQDFSVRYPGKTVELRVPPYGAIQCIPGAAHTRGTPPNVVEMSPEPFLSLTLGLRDWNDLIREGKILASGVHADLSAFFPLTRDLPDHHDHTLE